MTYGEQASDLDTTADTLAALEADVRELTHDLLALATLLGTQLGEPFRSKAAAIMTKRQTGHSKEEER